MSNVIECQEKPETRMMKEGCLYSVGDSGPVNTIRIQAESSGLLSRTGAIESKCVRIIRPILMYGGHFGSVRLCV